MSRSHIIPGAPIGIAQDADTCVLSAADERIVRACGSRLQCVDGKWRTFSMTTWHKAQGKRIICRECGASIPISSFDFQTQKTAARKHTCKEAPNAKMD